MSSDLMSKLVAKLQYQDKEISSAQINDDGITKSDTVERNVDIRNRDLAQSSSSIGAQSCDFNMDFDAPFCNDVGALDHLFAEVDMKNNHQISASKYRSDITTLCLNMSLSDKQIDVTDNFPSDMTSSLLKGEVQTQENMVESQWGRSSDITYLSSNGSWKNERGAAYDISTVKDKRFEDYKQGNQSQINQTRMMDSSPQSPISCLSPILTQF